jgi:hypothetical protein
MSSKKMCPILTVAVMRPKSEAPRILPVAGNPVVPTSEGFDAVPCAGPACMFFQPVSDASGRIIDGSCAISLIPVALSLVNDSMRKAASLDVNDKKGN